MSTADRSAGGAIVAEGVVKRYGSRLAVDHVSFEIPAGTVYGLLGPNGAGKSTLVRMLCGVLRPDGGRVTVLGWPVPSFRVQMQLGYMPQDVALYADLTVDQNLAMFGRLYDIPRGQIASRAEELLDLVDLRERRREKVGALSGGMQRRASLAVSLVHRPRVLFLDEPTAGVDLRLRNALWEHFRALDAEDVTLFITTHLMDEVERCRLLGYLHSGRLLAEGSVPELIASSGRNSLEGALTALLEEEGEPE
ncbi:MAG: ABC transporter ATP-binding protein [Candidatus Bipolaricaulota bacterium]|nr:MAG: ABC transporter ATP-binding protein [Candidatus Bipolaricaulota bacterium]